MFDTESETDELQECQPVQRASLSLPPLVQQLINNFYDQQPNGNILEIRIIKLNYRHRNTTGIDARISPNSPRVICQRQHYYKKNIQQPSKTLC